MGTNVVSGAATAVIALTGPRAYFGSLARIIAGERTLTSFDQGINRFAWLMIRFILVMAPLVFLINGFTKGDWMEALLFAMAVAVGLTPEMLPMIVTVNLGKGALAMSRRKVIVKRLNSIQNFGAMDILCADKTGTLTQDRIVLEQHVDLHGRESEKVLRVRISQQLLPVRAQEPAGRCRARVRGAARAAAAGAGLPQDRRDSVRLRAAAHVGGGRSAKASTCSSARARSKRCSASAPRVRTATACSISTTAHLAQLKQVSNELNEDGFRVIAIAYKELAGRHARPIR